MTAATKRHEPGKRGLAAPGQIMGEDVLLAVVRRTRAASGVPEQLEDSAAAEAVGEILKSASS